MKLAKFVIFSMLLLTLAACATDKHAYNQQPQKIFDAVNAKYPDEKNTLVFIDAPNGFIAPHLANCAVEKGVNNGKVVAITSSLALKTRTVIVAGEDESLTGTTLAKALTNNKEKISGSKVIVIGAKETRQKLTDLAAYNDVAIEFIDTPI
ncbi:MULTISPECIES: hypothetical protein [Methylotenera]|uniref:hypothetical protein n=1 Tax=Methylotenera TaxID=359407 RepID=UPI00035D0832|nr:MULTISPECIES: hypothetical protein [Methylotenera]